MPGKVLVERVRIGEYDARRATNRCSSMGGGIPVIDRGTCIGATGLIEALQRDREDFAPLWPELPEGVHVTVREKEGTQLWFVINDNDTIISVPSLPEGVDLTTGRTAGGRLFMQKEQVMVIKVGT